MINDMIRRHLVATLAGLALVGCSATTAPATGDSAASTAEAPGGQEAPLEHTSAPAATEIVGDLLDAFTNDGLAVAPAQDNTAIACSDAPCFKAVELTSERLSIWEFKTASDAEKWASVYPWTHVNGQILLRFTRDGLHPTSTAAASSYSQSLDAFMADR